MDETEDPDTPELDPNSSVIYVAMSMLCTNQNSLVPELLYLFKPQQIVNFIKIFSGETIKVPTIQEFNRLILTALACYHVIIQEKSFDWFAIKYEIDGNSLNGIKIRLESWINSLNEGERQFIQKLKAHELARKESNKKSNKLVRELYNDRT
jgi:hypothetical protein